MILSRDEKPEHKHCPLVGTGSEKSTLNHQTHAIEAEEILDAEISSVPLLGVVYHLHLMVVKWEAETSGSATE